MPHDDEALNAYAIASWLTQDPELEKDLINGYINAEVFSDQSLRQIYRTQLRQNTLHSSNRPPDEANIVNVQINGYALPFAIRESFFWMHVRGPNLKTIMDDYGAKTFDELRAAILNDPDFEETDRMVGSFFLRNFPAFLLSMYTILVEMSLAHAICHSLDDKQLRDATLRASVKRQIYLLERRMKEMIGTRKRGGSQGKLEVNKRRSLNVQYDRLLVIGKAVKKHYDEIHRTFKQNKRAYQRDSWRKFWLEHATNLYDYDLAFLALFSTPEDPSASEVAYRWLADHTGHSLSYVKQLVIKSRKQKK